MDIEEHICAPKRTKSTISLQLQTLLSQSDFSLKKVLILLAKHGDKQGLIQDLTEIYQNSSQLSTLANTLMLMQHFLTEQPYLSTQNDAKLRWAIEKNFDIRAQIDKYENISESVLEVLNKLLKIMKNIVAYFGKLSLKSCSSVEESPVFEHEMMFIIKLSGQKMYSNLFNQLFDINLFLKILENGTNTITFNEFVHQTIMQQFNHLQNIHPNSSQITKEILLSTLIKSLKMIKNFDQFMKRNLAGILTIFETKSRLRLIYELKQYNLGVILNISCQSEQQFQLLSLVIHEASQIPEYDISQLSEVWIANLFSLVKNDIEADLGTILPEFNGSFLITIYTKVSQLFSTGLNDAQDKSRVVYIWSKLLLCPKMHEEVSQNKSILINVELLLHQFIREILGLLNPTIDFQLYHLILQVFSNYHETVLKQKECIQIRHRLIKYIINRFPDILTQSMMFKDTNTHRHSECINIEDYNTHFLNELTRQCFDSTTKRLTLHFLQKRVSKILLKYLIDHNIVSITTLFDQNDIIAYTIQNDIEVHLDIYESLLQQKIYENVQTYLALVSKDNSKNRYRSMVDVCCLNLLINELQNTPNRKILKVSQSMMNLLIQNVSFLLKLSHESQLSWITFFNSLFSYITRSLYYNFPVTLNYLLIATLALKHQTIGSQLLQNEAKLIQEVVKFCKMYQGTHRSYFLLGFISLTILLYGLPCQPKHNIIGLNVRQVINDYTIFLQPITQALSGETQIIDSVCCRSANRLESEELFETTLKKCLNIGLIRHLSHVLEGKDHLETQIKQFNNLIKEVMMRQASRIQKKCESHSLDRNNRDDWTKYDDEQKEVQAQPQQKQKEMLQFIQSILKQYDKYDQFSQYRKLQKQISLIYPQGDEEHEKLLKSERVHGKIRTIFHVAR